MKIKWGHYISDDTKGEIPSPATEMLLEKSKTAGRGVIANIIHNDEISKKDAYGIIRYSWRNRNSLGLLAITPVEEVGAGEDVLARAREATIKGLREGDLVWFSFGEDKDGSKIYRYIQKATLGGEPC